MLYHQPDNRWPLFGCEDYETYLKEFLVKGNFHKKVPQDIIKEYETIEYLMAHAWYHYPMYDEAMIKLLRAFEIAIKQKSLALGIELTLVDKKKKRQDRKLSELIKLVCEKESGKEQKIFLDHLRELRNTFVHASQSSYMGGMHRKKIPLTINILNILFADEIFLDKLNKRREGLRTELRIFNQQILGLNDGQNHRLFHDLTFGDVFIDGEDEIVLIFLDPVVKTTPEYKEKRSFPPTMFAEIKNPSIENDILSGFDIISNQQISISKVTQPALLKIGKEFHDYLFGLKDPIYNPFLTRRLDTEATHIQNFRYKYYHSIR